MSLSIATPGGTRRTADYLFDLARDAQREFHKAKEMGDKDEMSLMGIFKSSCLFVASELSPDRFKVVTARDILHAEYLSVLHHVMNQDLHAPQTQWSKFNQMFDERRRGGSRR